jgi:hypothetical protein
MVTWSNREVYLDMVWTSVSSRRGKGLVIETKRSASPKTDSSLIVRESRKAKDSELPGKIW